MIRRDIDEANSFGDLLVPDLGPSYDDEKPSWKRSILRRMKIDALVDRALLNKKIDAIDSEIAKYSTIPNWTEDIDQEIDPRVVEGDLSSATSPLEVGTFNGIWSDNPVLTPEQKRWISKGKGKGKAVEPEETEAIEESGEEDPQATMQ